jgi:hypothetical protein
MVFERLTIGMMLLSGTAVHAGPRRGSNCLPYIAAGIAVVASRIGLNQELINPPRAGLLAD